MDPKVETPTATGTSDRRAPDPGPARTRAEILVAVERLSGVSPEEVTVAAIARDASVSRSAFYTQFSGLADLLSAVLGETAQHLDPDPLTSPAAHSWKIPMAT